MMPEIMTVSVRQELPTKLLINYGYKWLSPQLEV